MFRGFEDVAIGKGLLQKFSASWEIIPGTDGWGVCRIKASVQWWDNQQSGETTTEWGNQPSGDIPRNGGDRQSGEMACRMGASEWRDNHRMGQGDQPSGDITTEWGNRQSGETDT